MRVLVRDPLRAVVGGLGFRVAGGGAFLKIFFRGSRLESRAVEGLGCCAFSGLWLRFLVSLVYGPNRY